MRCAVPLLTLLLSFSNICSGFFPAVTNVSAERIQHSANEWEVRFATQDSRLPFSHTNSSGVFTAYLASVTTRDGIVMWTTLSAPSNAIITVYYSVFDPGTGSWATTNSPPLYYSAFAYSVGGIVTWEQKSGPGFSPRRIGASTYDPNLRRWTTIETTGIYTGEVYNNAYGDMHSWLETFQGPLSSYQTWRGFFRIYDPFRRQWTSGSSPSFDSSLCVIGNNEGTVSVTGGSSSQRYKYGFQRQTGGWQEGVTRPAALFAPSRTNGFAPLKVWFTDMSLGSGQ